MIIGGIACVMLAALFATRSSVSIVNISILPNGNYHVEIGNKQFKTNSYISTKLKPGEYNITIKNGDFEKYNNTIEVKKDKVNNYEFDTVKDRINKAGVIDIKGLGDKYINNYFVDYASLFSNGSLAVLSILNKTNLSDRLILIANKENGEWMLRLGPSEYIDKKQSSSLPLDVRQYLETFNNKSIEDSE